MIMTSVASYLSLAAVAALTLCPAWISRGDDNYGPLFSIVNGSYAITSIPAVVGWTMALMFIGRDRDERTAYAAFLLGCLGSMLSTMVTPSLGFVPNAGIFCAGYLLILIAGSRHFFPRVEENPLKFFSSSDDKMTFDTFKRRVNVPNSMPEPSYTEEKDYEEEIPDDYETHSFSPVWRNDSEQ